MFHRVLNNPPVLNMLGPRIWQGCKYARVTEQLSRQTYSEHCQTFKMERFAEKIMPECRCATRNVSGPWGAGDGGVERGFQK